MRLHPTIPFPHPQTHVFLLPGSQPTLSPPTSCLHLPLWPRPSCPQTPVTWDCQGPSWPLQGGAGKAGDAAVAPGNSQ